MLLVVETAVKKKKNKSLMVGILPGWIQIEVGDGDMIPKNRVS